MLYKHSPFHRPTISRCFTVVYIFPFPAHVALILCVSFVQTYFLFYFDPVLSTPFGHKRGRKWDSRTKPLKFVQTDEKLWEGFRNSLMHFKSLPAGHVICSLAWDKAFLFSGLKGQVDISDPYREWHTYSRDGVCMCGCAKVNLHIWLFWWLAHWPLSVCEVLLQGSGRKFNLQCR